MKKFILVLLAAQSLGLHAQFNDDFNDGYFQNKTEHPRTVHWSGNDAEFKINDNHQLQLASTSKQSPAQLQTASTLLLGACWEFDLALQFTPSAANYAKIYLASDEADLNSDLNGIFVRIGSADKNISLLRSKKGSANKILIAGEKKRLDVATPTLRIRVTLDARGNFNLYSQLAPETDFRLEGNCSLTDLFTSKYFGLVCIFTPTRSEHFAFDNFAITRIGNDPDPDSPREGDILFSEIMANPGADSTHPEYIELYNASDKTLLLSNCLFHYGSQAYTLPFRTIDPQAYALLCKTTAVDLLPVGSALGIVAFPVLANTGKLLLLTNIENEIVAWLEYSNAMYRDPVKKQGGWSLECIDLANRSNTAENWAASIAQSGGTPGSHNSVRAENPDLTPPSIRSFTVSDNQTATIAFSKPMDPKSLLNRQAYATHPPEYEIARLATNVPQADSLTVELNLAPPLGEGVRISLPGVIDRSGNSLTGNPFIPIGHTADSSFATSPDSNRITVEYPMPGRERYVIHYPAPAPNSRSSLHIYNIGGRRIARILQNEPSDPQGILYWDGRTAGRQKPPAGIYFLYLEISDPAGAIQTFKTPILIR
jgi:hypothetical protein